MITVLCVHNIFILSVCVDSFIPWKPYIAIVTKVGRHNFNKCKHIRPNISQVSKTLCFHIFQSPLQEIFLRITNYISMWKNVFYQWVGPKTSLNSNHSNISIWTPTSQKLCRCVLKYWILGLESHWSLIESENSTRLTEVGKCKFVD